METRILENSINKICSLLAIGFGDAGAEVIPPSLLHHAIATHTMRILMCIQQAMTSSVAYILHWIESDQIRSNQATAA